MNTFGRIFRVTTWGESHGEAVGCVVDGCPSGLWLTVDDIQKELDRRRPGQSHLATSRVEDDAVEILSGVFEDKTLGTPISMLIRNKDVDSSKYLAIRDTPRPGHGDLTWRLKFGHVDWRGGGRGSARETAARVAAGAIGKKLLREHKIDIFGFTTQIGNVKISESPDFEIKGIHEIIESNPVRTIDVTKARDMEEAVVDARRRGDSVGGVVECVALNVPAGLGEPIFNKLDAGIASAMMSIPGVKGVEIGKGFELAKMLGSEANDEFVIQNKKIKTRTNNSGGILGGISTGMPIVVRVAVKPTSSILKRQKTVNLETMKETTIKVEGRHDPCIVPRVIPVVEAMMALVLADQGRISGMIPEKLK